MKKIKTEKKNSNENETKGIQDYLTGSENNVRMETMRGLRNFKTISDDDEVQYQLRTREKS